MNVIDILNIKNPFLLFNSANNKEIFRNLIREFHPDKHNGEKIYNEACSHICKLYEQVSKCKFDTTNLICVNNSSFCNEYIYKDKIIYDLKDKTDFVLKVQSLSFKYANDDMKKVFEPILPKFIFNNNNIIVTNKNENLYSLKYIMMMLKKLDNRTVMWIISRLMNLCCFMQFNNIAYNNFKIENLYVDTKNHNVYLLCGWWFFEKINSIVKFVDYEIYNIISTNIIKSKICTTKTDLICIKNIAKKLLGYEMNFIRDNSIPNALKKWLIEQPGSNAFEEFQKWDRCIVDSFGKRKFTDFPINVNNYIYNA